MTRRVLSTFAVAGLLVFASCGRQTEQEKLEAKILKEYKNAKDDAARVNAVTQLAAMTENRGTAISCLKTALGDESKAVRMAALQTLQAFDKDAGPCLKKIGTMATQDEDTEIRALALDALSLVAKDDPMTDEALTTALNGEDVELALRAAGHLLDGPDVSGATVAAAAKAIAKAADNAVAKSEKAVMGLEIMVSFAMLGKKAEGAVPTLKAIAEKEGLAPEAKQVIQAAIAAINGSGQVDQVGTALQYYQAATAPQ